MPNEVAEDPGEPIPQEVGESKVAPAPAPYCIHSGRGKWFLVGIFSMGAFFSPLTAQIYFPVINVMAVSFDVSVAMINFTITAYMIFQGLAPTVFGPLSDGANIGVALSPNYGCLLVMRCVQSSGSSSCIAVGAACINDIVTPAEKAGFMGVFMIAGMFSSAIAPLIGSVLSETLGFRSIFWFLVIMSSAFLLFMVLFLPETLRTLVGNGSVIGKGILHVSLWDTISKRREKVTPQPSTLQPRKRIRILSSLFILLEKDVFIFLTYGSILYTTMMMYSVSLPILLQGKYGISELDVGLVFISLGIGCLVGPLLYGKWLDHEFKMFSSQYTAKTGKVYNRKSADLTDFPIEKARLHTLWIIILFYCISLVLSGWLFELGVDIAGPIVLLFFIGFTSTVCINSVSTLLVDLFPYNPASAVAGFNLIRCWMGAGGIALTQLILNTMGPGWTFTLLAGICAVTYPVMYIVIYKGPLWRAQRVKRTL